MMRAGLILAMVSLAACQPASDPAANQATETNAVEEAANEVTHTPPFAETPNAHPNTPEPAPIPAAFRGIWAPTAAMCADLDEPQRLVISGNTLRFHDFVIVGNEVTLPASNEFALKGKIEATGAPAEGHFSISKDGKTLTDGAGGGTIRVRCG